MGLLTGYLKSLKPLDVEEPIDVWVHRPLAYVLAWALYPTPVSPNAVTCCSILLGTAAGAWMLLRPPSQLYIAGLLIFLSAVFDCADGQLARMRKSSSPFGRMLDGIADLVVSIAVVLGSAWIIWGKTTPPVWRGLLAVALVGVVTVTSSFHTTAFEHYKNVFVRLTHPTYKDGEDRATALTRYHTDLASYGAVERVVWRLYLYFSQRQFAFLARFDPYTDLEYSKYPARSEVTAAIYTECAGRLMRMWRTWFGFGSLVFGLALFIGLGVPEYYLLFRLVALNGLFYGYMRPAQQAASRRAFAELRQMKVEAA
ncbi:MAG TPA: CDP-alcohol phosphatidyltransferase family protein [Polyangiaceae bacterium]